MKSAKFIATLSCALILSIFFGQRDLHGTEVPIFSRAQLKYGLGRTDYTHRWVDRPLFVDPTLSDPNEANPGHLTEADFGRMQQIAMLYGINGFGFFPTTEGRERAYSMATKNKVAGFELLTDFPTGGSDQRKIQLAGKALETPASFKIDGKVVIVSYLAGQKTPEYWAALFKDIRAAHGDHFIFLPALDWFAGKSISYWRPRFDQGLITDEEVEAIKENLREWARATDGLYSASASMYKKQRKFHSAFYREFIIKYMKKVLAEPEFVGKKYLALSACLGHENCTRLGYTLSCEGTATLRHSLEAALEAEPDLIVIPEWDEQNENTSLRPTVYNGKTAMRLLRHYKSSMRGELQEPLADDNVKTPNIIVSYRKIITLGESLTLELLHIPENGVDAPRKVKVELWNDQGKRVHVSPEVEIESGKLWTHRETIPSETFPATRYLIPTVRVLDNQGEHIFSEGLQAIELRSSWNWDYKWVMQPLREILQPEEIQFKVTAQGQGGETGQQESQFSPAKQVPLEIQAHFKAGEPLAYVEILDNDDVIYSHSVAAELTPRETKEHMVFRIAWQSMEWLDKGRKLQGALALKGASGKWSIRQPVQENEIGICFDNVTASIWEDDAFLSIEHSSLEEAILQVDLPGICKADLPLKKIAETGGFGIPGPVGFNMVISRYVRQSSIPAHLNESDVSFTIPLVADLPRSRLQLQAISVSGKVYRSRPFITGTDAPSEKLITVYSDKRRKTVEVGVNATLVPDIDYRFAPDATGSLLTTSAGRPFWGILGGFTNQATGRGGGECRDGTPFLKPADYPAQITQIQISDYLRDGLGSSTETDVQSAPDWRRLSDGSYALCFNGRSTFISLPQGVIPRRAGYELIMEVKPDNLDGKQLILANRSYYYGSVALVSEEGLLKIRFFNENGRFVTLDSGVKLNAGIWNKVRLRYDLERVHLEVNGTSSAALLLPGPGMFDTVTVIGGYGEEWFSGELKSLRVRHTLSEEKTTTRLIGGTSVKNTSF